MSIIGIEIPQYTEDQEIEVEVKINGTTRQYHYRVEVFHWDDCPYPTDDRVECIRQIVNGYDKNWELAHIGLPTEDYIPITFRKKRSFLDNKQNKFLV